MLQLSVASTCCVSQEEQNGPGGAEEATAQSDLPVQPEEPQFSIEFSTGIQTDGEWNAAEHRARRGWHMAKIQLQLDVREDLVQSRFTRSDHCASLPETLLPFWFRL